MSVRKPYFLTTPIYYVNDSPHIGHAYTTLACDALARFKRLDGFDVFFLTGTDEHGQKVEKSARDAGMEPQAFTDMVSENFRKLADAMNYSHDDFIRTTEPRHIEASQAIWRALKENGHIYLGTYAGWYAVRDEAFYGEGELTEGPDGKKIAPSGAEVEWVEEPSYFFDLSKWQDWLIRYYEDDTDTVAPSTRRNEVMSFVKGGLQDLSISRTSFKWGVPVPDDPDHIMYVWLDALTNYITAVGYPDTGAETFEKYWPADLHMVGKDILRFHSVYWPAFLKGAGIAPPKRVFAHGWYTKALEDKGAHLRILDPGMDTATSNGRLMLNVFGAVAQFVQIDVVLRLILEELIDVFDGPDVVSLPRDGGELEIVEPPREQFPMKRPLRQRDSKRRATGRVLSPPRHARAH